VELCRNGKRRSSSMFEQTLLRQTCYKTLTMTNISLLNGWTCCVCIMQVLAINRGENLKVLKVTLTIADNVRHTFIQRSIERFTPRGAMNDVKQLMIRSAEDAYDRLVLPLLIRGFR
jgi:transcriptional accessory protein Tex/SPT6